MDMGGENSYEGYPVEVSWGPGTPLKLGFSVAETSCENKSKNLIKGAMVRKRGFGCWDDDFGAKCQLSDTNPGLYDSFLMDNVEMWNSVPCQDLLALANAAITTKGSKDGGNGGDDEVSRNQGRPFDSDSHNGSCSISNVQSYGRADGSRYLFDLNSPPIVTEPHVSASLSAQLTLVTPEQTGRTDQAADEQPQLVIEQSKASNSTQLEVIGDFKKGSSNEIILNKTPHPKQRRRKHRPKVVIEGRTKKEKKSTSKPDGSSTGKRKYVRKIVAEETGAANDPATVRGTRHSCRRKINFDQDQNLHMEEKTQVDQALNPITPDKTEVPREKRTCSRAKCHIDFSQETRGKDPSAVPSQDGWGSKRERSNIRHESLEAYLSMLTNYKNSRIPGLHFPVIYKKKRTEKCQASVTSNNCSFPGARYAIKAPEMATIYGVKDDQQSYKHMLGFGQVKNFRKKRTKGLKRVRDLASFAGLIEGKRWSVPDTASGYEASYQRHTCMEALAADFRVGIATKKRSKRNYTIPSSLYHIRFHPGLRWKSMYDIDALIDQFERLDINEKDRHALIPYVTRYQEKNALSLVPFDGSYNMGRKRKPRPKVDLDDETSRVWRLLLEDINSQGIDGTDEDKAKWWEEERNVFRGRATSFIARMHLVQGDRRFSQWKGSVVDSVIGVFLTQNVSDHLSSSAFMSLAARYPLKSKSKSGNERVQEEKCRLDPDETIRWHEDRSNQQPAQEDADSYEETEVGNSNEFYKTSPRSQNSVETSPNSVQSSVTHTAERSGSCSLSNCIAELMDASKTTVLGGSNSFVSTMLHEVYSQDQANEPSNKNIEQDNLVIMGNSHEQNEGISHDCTTSGTGISSKGCELQTAHGSGEVEYIELREERTIMPKKREENFASEHSEISAESASLSEAQKSSNNLQVDVQEIIQIEMISENSKIDINLDVHENNCSVKKVVDRENFSAENSEVTESNNFVENSREIEQKIIESNLNEDGNPRTVSGMDEGSSKAKMEKTRKAKWIKANWDSLRISACVKCKREKTPNTMDSLDYEAVRCADVNEIADTIKERGMNNMLAERIKDFLNRLVRDHGSIDLEWLRDVPPDKAKEYLLSFRGLGLKSVECVRLLTLRHLAFPVDTNVGRIAVRLGWVPLQPLPESLQLHLLELYPVLESIQKYLWPRLCKLDQRTLYELHYQMITFGKVFCTKNKPNCNACPMRGECRHFASAFASARLALPAPEEKSIVSATENKRPGQNPTGITNQHHLTLPPATQHLQQQSEVQNRDPVIEEPATPEPIVEVPETPEPIVEVPETPEPEKMQQEFDIEDFCEDLEEIPTIKLNIEEFTQNLQTYMENNMELAEGDMSKALVALTSEAASIPTPKLKNVSQLRTEHQVYELPDSHPLLEGLDTREPDDPCSYLLAIWTPGETAESIQPPGGRCSSQESGTLCHDETCFLCNSIREANTQTVRGTLLIPCRTAMRGSFPLNGTYFQVNEVFADHDSSLNPIDVPRTWLWNLPRRTVYFGTSIPTIFKGLSTEGIQHCFWRGFVCVRGFDQKTRAPRPLMARLHFPASKLKRSRGKTDEG